jgi:sporulation integral membrane protein YtvI
MEDVMFLRTIINIALILLILYFLFTVGFSLVLAFLMAFLLEPIIIFLSNKLKLNRIYISLSICSLFTLLIIFLGYLLVAKVATETAALSRSLIAFTRDLGQNTDSLAMRYQDLFQSLSPEYQSSLRQATESLLKSLQELLGQIFSFSFNIAKMIPNFFIEVIIVFIAMYLISLRLPSLKRFFFQFFDPADHPRIDVVLQQLHRAIFGFIRAQLIISTFEFVFVLIGFVILDVPYPSATALIVTLVDILPILGTGAVMIPMAAYQYVTGNVFLGMGLLVHYGIIIIFRRIIDPKIMADSIGISPLAALVSMYLGLKLAGFVGLFLGPAVVILFQALLSVKIIKIKVKF